MPVGFRQAHAAVRHARFQVARALAILDEQERQVLHDLTAVVADCDRAFAQMQTNINRYLAASDALEVLEANREAGLPVNLEQLLDSQRRMSEAQSRYFLSIAEYTIATKNVQFEKGTLLHTTNLMIADRVEPADGEGFLQETFSDLSITELSMIEVVAKPSRSL